MHNILNKIAIANTLKSSCIIQDKKHQTAKAKCYILIRALDPETNIQTCFGKFISQISTQAECELKNEPNLFVVV